MSQELKLKDIDIAKSNAKLSSSVETYCGVPPAPRGGMSSKSKKKARSKFNIIKTDKDVFVLHRELKCKPRFTSEKDKDGIEWAKWSWNPVTGCLHGCEYCYARDFAERYTVENPKGFKPCFRPYRLSAPRHTKIPESRKNEIGIHNVFVCSMGELFGNWVPQEWIDAVLRVVRAQQQWNFLFLTKNPRRYIGIDFPNNAWVGTTVDIQARVKQAEEAFKQVKASVKFISAEPLLEKLTFSSLEVFDWVIIGGRSRSSRLPARQPKWIWVENLLVQARHAGCKVYFKPNLKVLPKEYPGGE